MFRIALLLGLLLLFDVSLAQHELTITRSAEGDSFELVDGRDSLDVGKDTLVQYLAARLKSVEELSKQDLATLQIVRELVMRGPESAGAGVCHMVGVRNKDQEC